ncbi:MAG TPA: CPBP family intramembrane glutamic endopeptidase [Chitinophagaceae bacterium]|nr:CPBP family intramembrane glutamic endopeptidase [Chitinophagaceae bacterium]
MKKIVGYLSGFSREVDKIILVVSTLFIAGMVWLNYGAALEERLVHEARYPFPEFTGRFFLFLLTFGFPYTIVFARKKLKLRWPFLVCLLVAPFLFALKAGTNSIVQLSADYNWNLYWNEILYWPVRTVLMFVALAVCWWLFHRDKDRYGLNTNNLQWKPYWLMLLCMIPLIAAASTQPDFLATYPKLKNILPLPSDAYPGWLYKLLYELGYGSDFFSIELFFRGFLVIGFSRWVGKEAIIPMACFYCSIHFGKPLGECISSYFGGLLLGIVSYHTRSIYGGLMVHLGIAWLMEAGAIIGGKLF